MTIYWVFLGLMITTRAAAEPVIKAECDWGIDTFDASPIDLERFVLRAGAQLLLVHPAASPRVLTSQASTAARQHAWTQRGSLLFLEGNQLRRLSRRGKVSTLLRTPKGQRLNGVLAAGGRVVAWTDSEVFVRDATRRWQTIRPPDDPVHLYSADLDAGGVVHVQGDAGYRCGNDELRLQIPLRGAVRMGYCIESIEAWAETGIAPKRDCRGSRFTLQGKPFPRAVEYGTEASPIAHLSGTQWINYEDDSLMVYDETTPLRRLGSELPGVIAVTRGAGDRLYAATHTEVFVLKQNAWHPVRIPCPTGVQ